MKTLIEARMGRARIDSVCVLVRPDAKPTFYAADKGWRFEVIADPDDVAADYRGVVGLNVFIHADDYKSGITVFNQIADHNPRLLCLNVPGLVARMTKEGINEWAV